MSMNEKPLLKSTSEFTAYQDDKYKQILLEKFRDRYTLILHVGNILVYANNV